MTEKQLMRLRKADLIELLLDIDSECNDLLAIANLEASVANDRASSDLNNFNYVLNTIATTTGFKGSLSQPQDLLLFFQFLRTRLGSPTKQNKKRRK